VAKSSRIAVVLFLWLDEAMKRQKKSSFVPPDVLSIILEFYARFIVDIGTLRLVNRSWEQSFQLCMSPAAQMARLRIHNVINWRKIMQLPNFMSLCTTGIVEKRSAVHSYTLSRIRRGVSQMMWKDMKSAIRKVENDVVLATNFNKEVLVLLKNKIEETRKMSPKERTESRYAAAANSKEIDITLSAPYRQFANILSHLNVLYINGRFIQFHDEKTKPIFLAMEFDLRVKFAGCIYQILSRESNRLVDGSKVVLVPLRIEEEKDQFLEFSPKAAPVTIDFAFGLEKMIKRGICDDEAQWHDQATEGLKHWKEKFASWNPLEFFEVFWEIFLKDEIWRMARSNSVRHIISNNEDTTES